MPRLMKSKRPETGPEHYRKEELPENETESENFIKAEGFKKELLKLAAEPEGAIRMCHGQGKSAVYGSEDGKWIIVHKPDGTIVREPIDKYGDFER